MPSVLLALVCRRGIPAFIFFSPSSQTLLLLLVILSAVEFSLSPFMCSLIFLSLSPASLLCNIFGELISSHPDNSSGPGVIITGYYSHLFHLWFHGRRSWSRWGLFRCTNKMMQLTVTHVSDKLGSYLVAPWRNHMLSEWNQHFVLRFHDFSLFFIEFALFIPNTRC